MTGPANGAVTGPGAWRDGAGDGEPGARAPAPLAVLDERDLDWIAEAIDRFARAAGQPWRVAMEALDALPVSRRRLAAVRGALARLTGTGGKLAPLGRRVRALVLGAPALSSAEREARLSTAAAALGVAGGEVERMLFVDLPGEREVVLPRGRPTELEVAALANVSLIQRAVAGAHRVSVTVRGDGGALLRAARARGLLVTASLAHRGEPERELALELVGPLALFQRTAVYGRTIGRLVPRLAAEGDFELRIETPFGWSYLASPVLLPHVPLDRAAIRGPDRIARALERLDRASRVVVAPPPLCAGPLCAGPLCAGSPCAGHDLACPDLAIDRGGARCYVELVGFWTADYLARKLATYREAGARVILCVDSVRGCAGDALEPDRVPPGCVVLYARRVTARAIADVLAGGVSERG